MLYKKFGGNIDLMKLQHNKKIKKDLEHKLHETETRITEQNQLRKYAQVSCFWLGLRL